MKQEINELQINGITYVRKDSINYNPAMKLDGMSYVICRTYTAGVFAGYLKERKGQEVVLIKARRLWKWVGAASLSQLAQEGVKNKKDSMFPAEVDEVILLQAIEILPCTEAARLNIAEVPIWKV